MVIFEVNNSSSVHIDNKKKDVLLLGFDDTTVTVKAEYSLTFTEQQIRFCSSIHHNGNKSFCWLMCLGYISRNFFGC